MTTLNTAQAVASLFTAPAAASAALAASAIDPVFGGSILAPDPCSFFASPLTGTEHLTSQYCASTGGRA